MKKVLLPPIVLACILITAMSFTGCSNNKPASEGEITSINEDLEKDLNISPEIEEETLTTAEIETETEEETEKETSSKAEDKKIEETAGDEEETILKEASEANTGSVKKDDKNNRKSGTVVNSRTEKKEKESEPISQSEDSTQEDDRSSQASGNRTTRDEDTHESSEEQTQSSNVNVVSEAQADNISQNSIDLLQTYQVYEEVTTVDDDYYQDYTETRRAEPESRAAEYIPPHIECTESPNGYHSWTSVFEWYNGDQIINTGAEPAGGFTSSVYLYSQCDYCGMKGE